MKIQRLILGPLVKDWKKQPPRGNCKNPDCGSDCDGPDCGLHKMGCIFGGFTPSTSYWTYNSDCPLFHGESK